MMEQTAQNHVAIKYISKIFFQKCIDTQAGKMTMIDEKSMVAPHDQKSWILSCILPRNQVQFMLRYPDFWHHCYQYE